MPDEVGGKFARIDDVVTLSWVCWCFERTVCWQILH